mgnify:FL=1
MQCHHIGFVYKPSNGEEINQSKAVQLVADGGDTLSTLGTKNFDCYFKIYETKLGISCCWQTSNAFLGLADSLGMDLVQLQSKIHEVYTIYAFQAPAFNEYKDLFEGHRGNLPAVYKMRLDPNSTPVVRPPREVPLAMEECVKRES